MSLRLTFNTACLCALTLLAGCGSPDAEVVETGAEGVRTIGQSASFRGINGILFGPDGDLYLTSVVTPALARIDPESGEILGQLGSRRRFQVARRPGLRPRRVGLLDRHQQRRSRHAHAGRRDARRRVARGRSQPDHLLGRRPAVRLPVLHGHEPVRARPGGRRGAAAHPRRSRARLRPERHGLGFRRRQALRPALVPRRGRPRRRRQRRVGDGRQRLRGAGRGQVQQRRRAPRARLAAGRGRTDRRRRRARRSSHASSPASTTSPSTRKTASSSRASPTASSSRPFRLTKTAWCSRAD